MGDKELSIVEQILEEHGVVERFMRCLERVIDSDDVPGETRGRTQQLIDSLTAFRAHLRKHFELEEMGGFLEDVEQIAPRFSARLAALREQHGRMLSELDDLIETLNQPARVPPDALRSRIAALLSTIKGHEREENELIQQVYYQELQALD